MKFSSFLYVAVILSVITSTAAFAQELYLNVPESDVAEKREVLVQQQFPFQNFYQSITIFDYGVAKG